VRSLWTYSLTLVTYTSTIMYCLRCLFIWEADQSVRPDQNIWGLVWWQRNDAWNRGINQWNSQQVWRRSPVGSVVLFIKEECFCGHLCLIYHMNWLFKKGLVFVSKSVRNEIGAIKFYGMLWLASVKMQYFTASLSFRISKFPWNMGVCWKVMPHNFLYGHWYIYISVKPK